MFARIRRVSAGLASLAGLRTELFAVELREQFEHWLRAALLAVVAVMLGCFGLVFLAVFVAVAFWETQPLLALGIMTVSFLVAAAWSARQVVVAFTNAPRPFSATIAEFQLDAQALHEPPPDPGAGSPGNATRMRPRRPADDGKAAGLQ